MTDMTIVSPESGSRSLSTPQFKVPHGACDCHMHVFGPAAEYPFQAERSYTPPDALPAQARAMLQTLGLERAVVVQASPYGNDNARVLSAIRELGVEARGVAAVSPTAAAPELRRLHEGGVRGLRLHSRGGRHDRMLSAIGALDSHVDDLDWHFDLHVREDALSLLAERLPDIKSVVVLDHLGGVVSPFRSELVDTLRRLIATGRCWVKLSAPYRWEVGNGRLDEAGALIDMLVRTNPERLVWGSDWPHTPPHGVAVNHTGDVQAFRDIDTGRQLVLFAQWVPREMDRTRILVANPETLYRFSKRHAT